MPVQYIHEPWTAPESVQISAKCIIGRHYSLPIVNHTVTSKINIQRMKQVYQQLSNYRNSESSIKYKEGYQSQVNEVSVSNSRRNN